MGQQHQLLAVRETKLNALAAMVKDTQHKFAKVDHYFRGDERTLKMLTSTAENAAIERAARTVKNMPTTVIETLEYMLKQWADTEDVLFQINKTNQLAKADVSFRGQVILRDIPVDELLGLETRLESLRKLLMEVPTLDSSKNWVKDENNALKGAWKLAQAEETTKTAKTTKAVVLYEATEKHPAQVKEVTDEITVGSFIDMKWSGACTPRQKADLLAIIDDLLVEVKKSRMVANTQEACTDKIGSVITGLLMDAFK